MHLPRTSKKPSWSSQKRYDDPVNCKVTLNWCGECLCRLTRTLIVTTQRQASVLARSWKPIAFWANLPSDKNTICRACGTGTTCIISTLLARTSRKYLLLTLLSVMGRFLIVRSPRVILQARQKPWRRWLRNTVQKSYRWVCPCETRYGTHTEGQHSSYLVPSRSGCFWGFVGPRHYSVSSINLILLLSSFNESSCVCVHCLLSLCRFHYKTRKSETENIYRRNQASYREEQALRLWVFTTYNQTSSED